MTQDERESRIEVGTGSRSYVSGVSRCSSKLIIYMRFLKCQLALLPQQFSASAGPHGAQFADVISDSP